MPEQDFELRSIAWSKVFPFLRLFRTFKLAIDMRQMALALACVLICYVAGRLLDRLWLWADAGAITVSQQGETEVAAYARSDTRDFARVLQLARDEHRRQAVAAVARWKDMTVQEAESLLETNSATDLLNNEGHKKQVAEIRAAINDRLDPKLDQIDDSVELEAAAKAEREATLRRQADFLRLLLAGRPTQGLLTSAEQAQAVEAFAEKDNPDDLTRFRTVIDRQRTLNELKQIESKGPFDALVLEYEARCFAAAIQGVCTGRWGMSGGALDAQPAMLGSVMFAGKGLVWLVTQRPWYAVIYGLIVLLTFAYFGAAICRYVAVRIARQESLELRTALGFACEKYSSFVAAPLIAVGIFLGAAVVLFLGGLVGAIPVVGELLSGLLYGLALLGGFALALILLGGVLGHNLMAPTIAIEGSDGFDALQHAYSYVSQRPWYAGFYGFVLLLYGGVCFVMVRLIAMLLLKLTDVATGAGINLASSSQTDTFGKLDAIWHMPAWGELALLPTTAGPPFWGTFHNAPLNWSEGVAFVLIASWVFLIVGIVGAFLVSFYFTGSTQMFFLLRHHVDAVDLGEIYYEEPESVAADDFGAPTAGASDAGEQPSPSE